MARTYLPKLIRLLYLFCQYAKRWEDRIKTHLTAPQIALFDALLVACEAFMDAVDIVENP